MHYLKCQLENYKLDMIHHDNFQNLFTINELYCRLVETSKLQYSNLINYLIRLILTLSVYVTTTERSVSTLKHIKTALCNKMEEEFLVDLIKLYIERDLVEDIDSNNR